ncbi:MAG: T9SS type A sorting domain-containing protein [Bacteroidetes bacterium]|nr:T9SS type A sorting domain-containing protein [Bacteroidota bacterium]
MKQPGKFVPLLFFLFLFSSSLLAQNIFFTDAGANVSFKVPGKRMVTPEKFRSSILDNPSMKNFLWSLPSEKNISNRQQTPILELPMPDGKTSKFHIWESPLMDPQLAAKYPEIKTFEGQGIDDPYATIRLDYNPYFGFNAQILSVNGNILITPYAKGDINLYTSFYSRDNNRNPVFICNTDQNKPDLEKTAQKVQASCRGTQLYTYRLALACTGEYAVAACSPNPATVPATLAAMVTSISRVNGIYESELSIRMVLVANTDQLIYLDGSTDPYTNNNGVTMLGQNQTNIDAVIGASNYDFGHVFSTGGGGVAGVGVICYNGYKARGVTGLPNPVGDNFDIDYVAHEMGHQFGANHTFNSSASNCGGGNRNESTAYEVGSGTTIMSYAGICSNDNIQPHSDPFFHGSSINEISDFLAGFGGSCAVITNTGNNLPVITSMSNNGVSIPTRTPFTLNATATDPDGDPLSYSWEEWDLGPTTTWNGGNTNTSSPLFKSRKPKTTGSRTFPDPTMIVANYNLSGPDFNGLVMGGNKGETLPTLFRTMNFRLTVRDIRPGGTGMTSGGSGGCQPGFDSPFSINVVSGTGPFVLTSPNTDTSFVSTSTITVTWDVAGTNAAPINTSNVKISLSTDGGLTFPTVLAASVPNTGSADVVIPNASTSTARIKIEALGNIFFDISDSNFTIRTLGAPFINSQPKSAATCVGSNATFGVDVVGLNLNYQWQLSTDGGTTFNDIPSANSDSYTANSVSLSMNNYQYRCVITGSVAPVAISNAALLSVISPVSISSQPSSVSVCPIGPLTPGSANFTVTGNSTQTIFYKWQVSTDGGNSFSDIPGATGATLFLSGITTGMNNNRYRCLLSNSTCTVPTISNIVTLTVYSLPTVNLTASPYLNLFPGLTTTLSAISSPVTGTNLTWEKNSQTIPGQTSSSYLVDVSGLGNYQVKIEDGNGCRNQSPVITIADSASNRLFIYPNPSSGQFTVAYYHSNTGTTHRSITIFDSHGAKVYNGTFTINNPYQLLDINMKVLAKGLYFIVVGDVSGKKIAEGKILIQ